MRVASRRRGRGGARAGEVSQFVSHSHAVGLHMLTQIVSRINPGAELVSNYWLLIGRLQISQGAIAEDQNSMTVRF
jgi:predicted GNAT superfamily acetyltransferase